MSSNLFADEVLNILKNTHSILENDHFVYASGDHGSGWIDKDAIYPDTKNIERLTYLLAETIKSCKPDIICGPAIGGLVISQWTAHHLGCLSVFTERDPTVDSHVKAKPFIFKRGYDNLVKGRKVLVVDDITNTGYSIKQTVQLVRDAGGIVSTAATLVTRGNVVAKDLDVEQFIYLLEYKIPAWLEAKCQLCKQHVPVNTKYAHGLEYVTFKKP